jgi:hypothetical protein
MHPWENIYHFILDFLSTFTIYYLAAVVNYVLPDMCMDSVCFRFFFGVLHK